MKKSTTHKHLLTGTSAAALAALAVAAVPAQAFAAWGTLTTATTTPQAAGANSEVLTIGAGGDIATSVAAVTNDQYTGTKIVVNAGSTASGITSTANSAISVTGAATLTDITVTKGTVSGGGTATTTSTIMLGAATGPVNLTNAGTIQSTGVGGSALYVGTGTVALNNSGTINTATGTASTIFIGSGGLAGLTGTNTGTISNLGGGNAITASNTAAINFVQAGGTITGGVVLGASGTSSLTVSGGTINGAVTLGNATQNLNLNGGQINGAIQGAGLVNVNADYVASGVMGGAGGSVTKIIVADGKTLNLATNNMTASTTGGLVVGTGATGATLTLGTGSVTGAIDTNTDGKGTLNFNANNTTNGNIGGSAGFGTINIASGATVDAASNNNTIKATSIVLNGSTSVLTLGTGAATGTITATTAGTGTVNFNGSQTNKSNIGSSTGIGAVNIANGATLTQDADLRATKVVVGGGASGALVVSSGRTVTGAVDIKAGASVTASNTATIAGAVTIGSGSTLSASNVAAITGLINGVTAGSGTLALTSTNSQTTNNAIGGTTGLAAVTTSDGSKVTFAHNVTATKVTIGGGTDGTATQTAGLITGNVAIAEGATLVIAGGSGVTGAIDGAANNTNNTLVINSALTTASGVGTANGLNAVTINSGGNVTLGANVKAATTTVAGTGVLNFGSASRTITGNLTGAGATATMNLGGKAHTVTGNLTTGAANTIGVQINSGTGNDSGKITSTNATIAAGTTINVDTSKASSFIASGTSYLVVAGTGAHTNAGVVTDNSAVLTFVEDRTTNDQRKVTATRTSSYQALATNTNAQGIGTVLTNLAASGTGTLAAFQGALDNAANGGVITSLIEQVTPQVEAGSIQAVQSVGQSLDVVSARLSNLRAGIDTSNSGMAAGGAVADRGIWVQAFGMTADQERRNGISGFDVDTYGVAAGADSRVADHTRLGVSASYGNTDLQGTGAGRQTDIDSYQVNLYGTHDMGRWFVDGLVGYAWQRYDSTRNITAASTIANADYDGHTYTLRANTGYRLDAGNGIQVIPNAGLTYFNNNIDGYTETGAGALNLRVDDTDAQSLFGRVGFDLAKEFESSGMIIRPTVRAAYLYDFLAEEAETTALFTGGGASFRVTDARPERSSFNLGASLNVMTTQSVTLSADYDYVGRSNYDAHSGMLRARFGF